MDVHPDLGDATEADIKAAHKRDLEVQADYGVQFLTYWFNSPDGHAFCLVEAPSGPGTGGGYLSKDPDPVIHTYDSFNRTKEYRSLTFSWKNDPFDSASRKAR